MSWAKLLADRRVKTHVTSPSEITQLRAVVARDLTDAQVVGLSPDRKFACLYSAALQLAHMVIACAGYRVSATSGHHKTSFEVLTPAMGQKAAPYAVYFDICRRKRNIVEYDNSSVATQTEVNELLIKVQEFEEMVEQWIKRKKPHLSK